MRPTAYIKLGAGLVFLILGTIVIMSWLASNRVGEQHSLYLVKQQELRILDRLRASINRIVSSTNEFALIAMTTMPAPEEKPEDGASTETPAIEAPAAA